MTDQNDQLRNCTMSPVFNPIQLNFRLYGNMPITLVGIATNILNVLVFRHCDMRNSLVNWFLLAITGSDLALLICNFFLIIIPVVAEVTQWVSMIAFYPYLVQQIYPLALIAQTSGVYQTVLASLHRYLGVCHPFRAQRWVSRAPVRLAIFAAVLFSILMNVSRCAEIQVGSCYHERHQQEINVVQMTDFAMNADYFLIYKVCIYTFIMFLLPFLILITVNCRMVQALRNSQSLRRRTGSTRSQRTSSDQQQQQQNGGLRSRASTRLLRRGRNRDSQTSSNRGSVREAGRRDSHETSIRVSSRSTSTLDGARERGITMMLVAVVVMFLVCNSLAFINNILEIIFTYRHDRMIKYRTIFDVAVETGNILIALNSSATIIVYLIFSSKYRSICWRFFCRKNRRKRSAVQRATFKHGLIRLQNTAKGTTGSAPGTFDATIEGEPAGSLTYRVSNPKSSPRTTATSWRSCTLKDVAENESSKDSPETDKNVVMSKSCPAETCSQIFI